MEKMVWQEYPFDFRFACDKALSSEKGGHWEKVVRALEKCQMWPVSRLNAKQRAWLKYITDEIESEKANHYCQSARKQKKIYKMHKSRLVSRG